MQHKCVAYLQTEMGLAWLAIENCCIIVQEIDNWSLNEAIPCAPIYINQLNWIRENISFEMRTESGWKSDTTTAMLLMKVYDEAVVITCTSLSLSLARLSEGCTSLLFMKMRRINDKNSFTCFAQVNYCALSVTLISSLERTFKLIWIDDVMMMLSIDWAQNGLFMLRCASGVR